MPATPREHHISPFSPGYGKQPLVFGGHGQELDDLTEVFDTLDFGENHSVLLSGLRGAGKTSMLTVLQDRARDRGWMVISDDASSGLMTRVMESSIPALLNTLPRETRARLTSVGIWQFNARWEYQDRHREVRPQLRHDLVALSNAAEGRGILITIDEVSSGKVRLRELSTFALQISHAISDGADIMVVFAGVKVNLEELLKQEHTTFLRRSREIEFQRLSTAETRSVLEDTIRIGGRDVTDDALDLLVAISQGYPYLVQLAGDYAWRNDSGADAITLADAHAAHRKAIKAVQDRVISRVYHDLSEKDQAFLNAMAPDENRTRVADIVKRMRVSDQYVQVYKKRLIDSGYVRSDGHGYVVFSLPYLGQYVRGMLADALDDGRANDGGWGDYPAPSLD